MGTKQMVIKLNYLVLQGTSTVTEIKILSYVVVLCHNKNKQLSYRCNQLNGFSFPVIFISAFLLSHVPRIRLLPDK
jgi:hypothetical protein